MRILTSPDPLLRQVCEPVEVGDKSIKKLAKQMIREMYRADGVGLAAPQVGILKRFVVIDCDWVEEDEDGHPLPKNPIVLVNPEIVEHAETTVPSCEGCLSVPGISVDITRWEWVRVRALNEDFEPVEYCSDGLFGRCMQHELDHLDGKTLFERLSPMQRIEALNTYNEMQAQMRR